MTEQERQWALFLVLNGKGMAARKTTTTSK